MVDEVVVLENWPQPTSGAPEPRVSANDVSALVRYFTPDDDVAVVYFPSVSLIVFGAPNDEALGGHPLSSFGLTFYSVHEVRNSSRILELERQNSVHPSHDKARFLKGRRHYVFTFHDSTLEVVTVELGDARPEFAVFPDESAALEYWKSKRGD